MAKILILVVCTANICRSPMAQGLLQHGLQERGMGKRVKVDSAGTRLGSVGLRPDQRAQAICREHGIEIGRFKSRPVTQRDFSRQDLIVAMDDGHVADLFEICPQDHQHKISKAMDYAPGYGTNQNVPDPYFGNISGFAAVFDMLSRAMEGIIMELENRL